MRRMHQPLMLLAMALCFVHRHRQLQTVQAEEIDTSNPFKLLEQVSERYDKANR